MACHWKQWRWIWCIEINGVWEGKVMSLQVMWGTAQERCHTVGCDAFSLCPEQYKEPAAAVRVTTKPRTRLRTCLLVYHPTVPRPDIHTHTHTHGSVTSLSSILFSVCSLSTVVIVNTTSHLPFVYTTVTTKPSELFLKVWTKRSDLHSFVVVVVFCVCTPTVCSLIVHFALCTNITCATQKSAFNIRDCKAPGPQSSFSILFKYASSV